MSTIQINNRYYGVSFVVYQLHNQLMQAKKDNDFDKCDKHIRQLLSQKDCPVPLKDYYRGIAKDMGIDLENSLLNAVAEMDISTFAGRKEQEKTSYTERLKRLSSELNLKANQDTDDYEPGL